MYEKQHRLYFYYKYMLLCSACLNYLLVESRKKIFRILDTIGFVCSIQDCSLTIYYFCLNAIVDSIECFIVWFALRLW